MLLPLENPWGIDLWLLKSNMAERHLGGNKYHKLTGYAVAARDAHKTHLITMAGAHSNHLRAFAALSAREGFVATALVRGDELHNPAHHSETIRFALEKGVKCVFIARAVYRHLREAESDAQRTKLLPGVDFMGGLFIPEGGLGPLGAKGVTLWAREAAGFAAVYIPSATGTTAVGFLLGTQPSVRVVGVAVLNNGAAIEKAIRLLVPEAISRFRLLTEYSQGGFAKVNESLLQLADDYSAAWGVTIDSIYMAKAVMALRDQAAKGNVRGRTLLVYTYNE